MMATDLPQQKRRAPRQCPVAAPAPPRAHFRPPWPVSLTVTVTSADVAAGRRALEQEAQKANTRSPQSTPVVDSCPLAHALARQYPLERGEWFVGEATTTGRTYPPLLIPARYHHPPELTRAIQRADGARPTGPGRFPGIFTLTLEGS